MWDYARMAEDAAKYGGPEKYLEVIYQAGQKSGIKKILPITVLFAVPEVAYGIAKGWKHFQRKKEAFQNQVDYAKAEIIQGVENYNTFVSKESEECEQAEEAVGKDDNLS